MSAPSEMAGGQMSAIDEKGGKCPGGKCPYTICMCVECSPDFASISKQRNKDILT